MTNVISCFVKIAIEAIVAPREREPVSPIIILAGFVLKNKYPKREPTKMKQNTAISSYPIIQTEFQLTNPSAKKAIKESPPASPSKPSVIFTALLLAIKINKINTPYNQLISIRIPSV